MQSIKERDLLAHIDKAIEESGINLKESITLQM